MIQLANDPDAARSFARTPPANAKPTARIDARRRSAHAWPFPSRYAQPSPPDLRKPAANDSGS